MAKVVAKTRFFEKVPRVADIKSFRFERPPDWDYKAGQWFVITIPGPDGILEKHFTQSSSPTEPFLEVTTRLTGSEFKNALDAMPLGTEMQVEGPYGSFVYEAEEPVVFLTGGIGITPIRSILRDLTDRGVQQDIIVLFGNRAEDAIPFRDELDEFQARNSSLKVVHVLSDPGKGWTGHTGHITSGVISAEVPDPSSWRYLVSGPPGMVRAMREVLEECEVPREQVTFENFEGYE